MIHAIKLAVGRALNRIVVFRSFEYRITVLDLLRRTPALRGEISPPTVYLDWRHNQIERLDLTFYRNHPAVGDIFDSYYGKLDRVSLVVSYDTAPTRPGGRSMNWTAGPQTESQII